MATEGTVQSIRNDRNNRNPLSGLAVGRMVHFVSRGSADGVYPPLHVAATVTVVESAAEGVVSLYTMYRTGVRHELDVPYGADGAPGTWHWPEFVP